ncbi:CoA transferase [Myxococcota bacterium]|nr:CoA transferase [Myxococcota bacterium]
MALPLEGIRVVDWTIWQQGPVASAMLADLGAEVIKVELRGSGDPGRGLGAVSGNDLSSQPNFYFEANNRNKQSISIDLKKPEAREVMHDLVAKSDVFVQNFRKGVAGRLGLDYETLKARNERLIYASATGYGPEGPDSGEPSFDILGQARSGIMLATGEPDMPPLPIAAGIADQMGAIMLAYGILAALMARERLGVGQQVDASHLGSMMAVQGLSLACRLMMGNEIGRVRRSQSFNPLWNHYRCSDGQWIALGMNQADRYWSDFCKAIGCPEIENDPRFENMGVRAQNSEACVAIIDEAIATKTRDEWMEILKHGGDFIYTIVNTVNDLPDDPQVRINGYVEDFEHPSHGTIQVPGIPIRLSETPGSIRTPAPEFGQHTETVLMDVLGYDWDHISTLREQEVI